MENTPPAIRVEIDPEIADLVPGYLANRRRELSELQILSAAEDWPRIAHIAHRLKGSGGGYGFDALTTQGIALEEAAFAADAEAIRQILIALDDYLARVRPVIP